MKRIRRLGPKILMTALSTLVSKPDVAVAFTPKPDDVCFFSFQNTKVDATCESHIKDAAAAWFRERDGLATYQVMDIQGTLPAAEVMLLVRGQASDAGSANNNLKLSIARAEIIADLLRRVGIPARCITTVGESDRCPLVAVDPLNAENRRVEIGTKAGTSGPCRPS